MNSTEIFLSLLGMAVHNKPIALRENVNFGEVLSMAQAHNVLSLVFEKLCEVPDFREHPEFGIYGGKAMEIIAMQVCRTERFLELYQAFTRADIHPIIMKGIICRQLYGELGDHRPSGDEDILIRKSEFEKVMTVLQEQEFEPEQESITEKQLDELQEISFYNRHSGLVIEVHTNPIGKENDIRCRMNDCFQDVFEHPKQVEISGTLVWTMNDTDHFLFLILHAFKHMTVTGFGIRQVLDILLFYEQNESTIDIPYVLDMLESVKAQKFFSDLIHLGNQYLGFHISPFGEEHCMEELLEDLMRNGVFGNMTQAQQMSRIMTNEAVEHGNRKGGAKLIYAIFPSRKYLMVGYPKLVEKPWLLPVYWVQRWVRFIRHNMKNGGGLAKESMEISQQRIELLKKYEII